MENEFDFLSLIELGMKSDLIKIKDGEKIPYRFSELFSHYLRFHTLLKLYQKVHLIDDSSVLSLENELDSVLAKLRNNIKKEFDSINSELGDIDVYQ